MINKVLFILLLSLLSPLSSKTYADDIEIFVGHFNEINPNILMIMDTSESMNTPSDLDEYGLTYDPNIIYPNDIYEFESSAQYIFRYDDQLMLNKKIARRIKDYKIDKEIINCKPNSISMTNHLERYGFYKGQLRYYFHRSPLIDLGIAIASWTAPSGQASIIDDTQVRINNQDSRNIIDCKDSRIKTSGFFPYRNFTPIISDFLDFIDFLDLANIVTPAYIWTALEWGLPGINTADWNNGQYYSHVFSGNYLNYLAQPYSKGIEKTRLQVLSSAAIEVINSIHNINLAVMRFDAGEPVEDPNRQLRPAEGGYVAIAMDAIEDIRQSATKTISSFIAEGNTPLSETLHEAYQYLRGSTVEYGIDALPGPSAEGIINSRTYIAPPMNQCTKSKVILFSDGEATHDYSSNSQIFSLFNRTDRQLSSTLNGPCTENQRSSGACLSELSYAMNNLDFRPDIPKKQIISIDTIGGFLSDNQSGENARQALKEVAKSGNGNFYLANDHNTLVSALKDSIFSIDSSVATLSMPSISSASDTQVNSIKDIYYTVFEPSKAPGWRGNLKRYQLSTSGEIIGMDGKPAIQGGEILKTAVSYWSNKNEGDEFEEDGYEVTKGGVANQLNHHRRIYTQDKSRKLVLLKQNQSAQAFATLLEIITDDIRQILTAEKLGIPDTNDDIQDRIRAWILGYNADKSFRLEVEDSLHTRPIKVNYSKNNSTLFFMTNSGYLHAIDPATGKERFSFIPSILLKNPAVYVNADFDKSGRKRYGLDGSFSIWREDKNNNGTIDSEDRVILYFGMRRGGYSYFALDISNRDTPKLLWQINGNYPEADRVNKPSITAGYSKIGQTWSTLIPAEIQWQGENKVVLITSGGYDPIEDGTDNTGPMSRIQHTLGTTIYIIDALTGDLLFDAKAHKRHSQMTSSFAADPVPIDITGNGKIDRIYAADVGGRLWRLDLNSNHRNGQSASDLVSNMQVLADINSGNQRSNRRFFNRPDVSLNPQLGNRPITISIGSGYRAHPLSSQIDDYHYIILDSLYGQQLPQPIRHHNLQDWGRFNSRSVFNLHDQINGWRIPLVEHGEKALSPSITLQGKINFATYSLAEADNCIGNRGTNYYYTIDINDAFQTHRQVTKNILNTEGIAPTPIVFSEKIIDPEQDDQSVPNDKIHARNCTSQKSAMLIGAQTLSHNLQQCDLVDWGYWKELF